MYRAVLLFDRSFSLSFFFSSVKLVSADFVSADKETQVRSEDFGRDLSSVQTFLSKQVNISANYYALSMS